MSPGGTRRGPRSLPRTDARGRPTVDRRSRALTARGGRRTVSVEPGLFMFMLRSLAAAAAVVSTTIPPHFCCLADDAACFSSERRVRSEPRSCCAHRSADDAPEGVHRQRIPAAGECRCCEPRIALRGFEERDLRDFAMLPPSVERTEVEPNPVSTALLFSTSEASGPSLQIRLCRWRC